MNTWVYQCTAFLFAAGFLGGVKLMQSPETAVKGNSLGAFCMLGAIVMTLISNGIINDTILWLSLSAGGLIGYWIAIKVTMIQMPQLVAFLNGLGGGASAVTALLVLLHMSPVGLTTGFTGALALSTGSVTLSGSMIAAAKLDQKITQQPVIVRGHSFLSIVTLFLMGMLIILVTFASESALKLISIITIVHALMAGVLFTIRIGGADMPITISLLNALSGLAGSIAGFAIHNSLLVAVGAIVGSSGLILTRIMCSAMNRSLVQIITGTTTYSCSKRNALLEQEEEYPDMAATDISTHHNKAEHYQTISSLLREAKKVVIVPGYGMAVSQAQYQVKKLFEKLQTQGKEVQFAIHPVAGRMPGHMNVLLAEVDVPYDKLCMMADMNPSFKDTDVVIVVGANDIVNTAAATAVGTPIYGMPVLKVNEAKHVIICNKDTQPGYSGVKNPLYKQQNAICLLGDASNTIEELLKHMEFPV